MGRISLAASEIKLISVGAQAIQRVSIGTTEIWTAKLLRNLVTEDFLTGRR